MYDMYSAQREGPNVGYVQRPREGGMNHMYSAEKGGS